MQKAFTISNGKGFQITLPNGYIFSVQFGPGNYCDHHKNFGFESSEYGKIGSNTAECAVIDSDGEFVNLSKFDGYDRHVTSYSDVETVINLMNWAMRLPFKE
jgi:hypothetical protein